MKRNGFPSKDKSPRLDLGLGSILSSFEDDSSGVAPVASSPHTLEKLNPQVSSDTNSILGGAEATASAATEVVREAPILSKYQELARDEEWGELALLCENTISANKDAGESEALSEARLWWVKSQLKNGSMPMSILAAPLDSASKYVCESEKASYENGKGISSLLELCLSLLKEASEILIKNSERALAITFLERAYAVDKHSADQYRRAMEAELEQLRASPKALRDAKTKNRISKLEAALAKLPAEMKEAQKVAAVPAEQKTQLQEMSAVSPSPSSRGYKPLAFAGVGAAAFALILLSWHFAVAYLHSSNAEVADAALVSAPGPQSILPELQRVAGVSNLDAVYYDIDGARARLDATHGDGAEAKVESRKEAPVVQSAVALAPRGEKEIVNTSGPLEGPEFREALAAIDVKSGARRNDLFIDQVAQLARAAQSAGPQGAAVEKYDADKLFIVMVKTSVMARPSYETASLAELEAGDKVLVEGKLGPWLKLRSKHGQAGYILAQDAELGSGK